MSQRELIIDIPEGMEIDKEKSTFEKIIFKKRKDILPCISGYVIDDYNSSIFYETRTRSNISCNKNIFLTKKHAISALAMAQISQLINDYGGEVTSEEWKQESINKYIISRYNSNIFKDIVYVGYCFLAFHTASQRNSFFENNENLIKQYYMID
jgi:hypothetical protein